MRRALAGLIVLAIVVVVSCNPDDLAAPGHDTNFLIQDGANGGNPHFFLLPPLVPQPLYRGTPDGTLKPEVTVCQVTSGNGCGPVLVRFTTTLGATLLEKVRYDPLTGSYYVVWDTRKCLSGPCNLDPEKRYRMRVSIAGIELGWADLDVVAKLKELSGVNWGTDVGVVREAPLPIRFRIEKGSVAVISVLETIGVKDGVPVLDVHDAVPPTVEIAVTEKITVSDAVGVRPPVTIDLDEVIGVQDAERVVPPVSITIEETVGVSDAPVVTPQ